MKNLPIKNLWCIRRGKRWKEYQENGAVFYLIINNNYTDDSNCRYVMVEMYPNGDIGYWSTDNELIDEQGSTKRLPPLAEYQQTLGNALQKIQELHQQVMNNNQLKCNLNMNKKLIRLTEQDLHRIVKESVNRILNEGMGDETRRVLDELHQCLHKAKDLASDLIGLASDNGDKYALGYAITVQNALETLFYEKLDNKNFDNNSIYPKGPHWEGITGGFDAG